MTIEEISLIFLDAVEALLNKNGNKKIYVLTNKGNFINFRSGDFKRALKEVVAASELSASETYKYKESLNAFRVLEYIVCKPSRFTNTQYIDGKAVRVITVSNSKYLFLKSIKKEV